MIATDISGVGNNMEDTAEGGKDGGSSLIQKRESYHIVTGHIYH